MGTGTVEFLQFRGLSYLLGGFHSRHYDQVATAVSADVGRAGSDFGANPRRGLSSRPGRPVFLSLFHSHPARRLLVYEHCKPRLRHDRPAHQSQSHGGFERRFFPGLPHHRGFASPRIEFGNLDRAAHCFSSRRLGFLALLLSFLSALEFLPRPPVFWRDVNLRSPGCVFSGGRLFGIAFSHGAHWLYLLEWRERSRRQDLGRAARRAYVGDPHRRNCLRGLSNCDESFWSKLEWIARLAGLGAAVSLPPRPARAGAFRTGSVLFFI